MSDEPNIQSQEDEDFDDWSEFEAGDDSSDGEDADKVEQLEKQVKFLAKQLKKRVDNEEVDRLKQIVDAFSAEATDEMKELAEIYLEGVESPRQAEKAIEKIKARAAKLNPDANIGDAFEPPSSGTVPKVEPEGEALTKRLKAGKVGINDLMDTWVKIPGQVGVTGE